MPLYNFIPEIEILKNKISAYLSTGPENFSFVWNKFDALLSLSWYLKDRDKIKKIVYSSNSEHEHDILKIAKLLNLSTNKISLLPTINEIRQNVREDDLLIIGNPVFPLSCMVPLKRIARLAEKNNFNVIFDISLSFYWLGYDLYKTPVKYAIFSMDRFNSYSSPVVIFHKEFDLKYLTGTIKHWSFSAPEINFEEKQKLYTSINEIYTQINKILTDYGFIPVCSKIFPLISSHYIPKTIDTNKLSSLLQFNDINYQIIPGQRNILIISMAQMLEKNLNPDIINNILLRLSKSG